MTSRRPRLRPAALLAGALVIAPGPVRGQDARESLGGLSRSFEALAARVSPAVVQIFASGLSIRRGQSGSGQDIVARQNASGSGVIVDPSGYIVTNAHVVSGATRVLVSLPDPPASAPRQSILRARGAMLEARIVGTDGESDLAVLKIERDSLPYVPFGDSDELSQGELVFAFGSPLGLDNSVTMGVVSSVARQLQLEGPMIYVQTDAAVNPGNSGGPLVDTEGRLVGVNTLIYSRSGGSDGLSFAAPSNIVRSVFEQIRDTGRVRRGAIGARTQTVTPALAAGLGLSRSWGVILSDVFPGSPAAVAGLRPGDVILRLDGKLVENARQFDINVYRYAPGSRVTLEILRDDEPATLQVPVVERREFTDPLAEALATGRNLVQELGIFGVDLVGVFQFLPSARSRHGVVVAALTLGPLGVESAFHTGDVIYAVNGQPVEGVADLRLVLSQFALGDAVVFHVQRSSQLIYLPVTASW